MQRPKEITIDFTEYVNGPIVAGIPTDSIDTMAHTDTDKVSDAIAKEIVSVYNLDAPDGFVSVVETRRLWERNYIFSNIAVSIHCDGILRKFTASIRRTDYSSMGRHIRFEFDLKENRALLVAQYDKLAESIISAPPDNTLLDQIRTRIQKEVRTKENILPLGGEYILEGVIPIYFYAWAEDNIIYYFGQSQFNLSDCIWKLFDNISAQSKSLLERFARASLEGDIFSGYMGYDHSIDMEMLEKLIHISKHGFSVGTALNSLADALAEIGIESKQIDALRVAADVVTENGVSIYKPKEG